MTLPPAGWYDDPDGADGLRYYDGQNWTFHRQSRNAVSGGSPGRRALPNQASPGDGNAPRATVHGRPHSDYLAQAADHFDGARSGTAQVPASGIGAEAVARDPRAELPVAGISPVFAPGGVYVYGAVGAQQTTNGLAIASLVVSLVGFPLLFLFGIGLIPAIVGLILGFVALHQIKRTGRNGHGLALAGVIVGGLGILVVFTIPALLVVFNSR